MNPLEKSLKRLRWWNIGLTGCLVFTWIYLWVSSFIASTIRETTSPYAAWESGGTISLYTKSNDNFLVTHLVYKEKRGRERKVKLAELPKPLLIFEGLVPAPAVQFKTLRWTNSDGEKVEAPPSGAKLYPIYYRAERRGDF